MDGFVEAFADATKPCPKTTKPRETFDAKKLKAADPDGALEGLIVAEPGVGYRVARS